MLENDSTIIASPCHGRRVRVPANRGALDVKCPEYGCGQKWRWSPDSFRNVPSPLIVPPRAAVISEAVNDNARKHPATHGVPMLRVEYGELQIRCAKTGLRWSAGFEKSGNSDKYVFVAAREGGDIALELMFARLSGNREFRATRPTLTNFKRNELLFGNAKCPGCNFVCHSGWTVLTCGRCNSYTCCGMTRELGQDEYETVCHPDCPTYPKPLRLVNGSDQLTGYHMRVYRVE